MSEQRFFKCLHCANMIGLIHGSDIPMVCCGENMQELIPNTTDGAAEKHVPVVSIKERLVHITVGSVPHPMTAEHHIEFIYLQTTQGGQMKRLCVGAEPAEIFAVLNDAPISAYAYCNLHGLWKVEIVDAGVHHHDEATCSAKFSDGCK